jgi:hypothetical protein
MARHFCPEEYSSANKYQQGLRKYQGDAVYDYHFEVPMNDWGVMIVKIFNAGYDAIPLRKSFPSLKRNLYVNLLTHSSLASMVSKAFPNFWKSSLASPCSIHCQTVRGIVTLGWKTNILERQTHQRAQSHRSQCIHRWEEYLDAAASPRSLLLGELSIIMASETGNIEMWWTCTLLIDFRSAFSISVGTLIATCKNS